MPSTRPRATTATRRAKTGPVPPAATGTAPAPASTGLLHERNAIIYGGGGGIGGGIARAFAREGAKVFLAGRTLKSLEVVAEDIKAAGGAVEVAELDATDEKAVDKHAAAVMKKAKHIDISFNAIAYGDLPGLPMVEFASSDFAAPVTKGVLANFVTARAAARYMVKQGSGVVLTLTNGAATSVAPMMGTTGITAAAIETFTRYLACELGPQGVRVLGLRIAAVPDTWAGMQRSDFDMVLGDEPAFPDPGPAGAADPMAGIIQQLAQSTMLHRLSTLAEVANVALFLVSDRASAMTGTVTNVTCGMVRD